jgi:hypothetical protein
MQQVVVELRCQGYEILPASCVGYHSAFSRYDGVYGCRQHHCVGVLVVVIDGCGSEPFRVSGLGYP